MNKFLRGYTLASYDSDSTVFANALITFFDSWSELKSDLKKEYVVFHEVAHFLGSYLKLDETSQWKELFECGKGKNCFISFYAKTSYLEDFAESVSAYRFNASTLKTISPKKYEYIKETLFRGQEFTDQETCSKESTFDNKVVKKVIQNFKENPEIEVDYSLKNCPQIFLDYVISKNSKNDEQLLNCFGKK